MLNPNNEAVACKYCGSHLVRKYGHYKDTQRYFCNDCQRKFSDNDNLFRMRLPASQIASALNMYYEGMSLNAISRQFKQDNGTEIPDKTIFYWVDRFTDEAVKATQDIHPKVGNTWIADETYVRVDMKKTGDVEVVNPYSKSKTAKWVIFWDIIDSDTRFLLASHVTTTRNKKDAQILMEKAAKRAGKTPKVVVTDSLKAYLDGIEIAYGADAQHKQGSPFKIENNTNLIERFHSSLKSRTKVMRALKNRESCRKFTDGWLFHYNFIRPHMTLEQTPAQKAGVDTPYSNWSEFIRYTDMPKVSIVQAGENIPKFHFIRPTTHQPRPRRQTFSPPSGVFEAQTPHGKLLSRRPIRGHKSRRVA